MNYPCEIIKDLLPLYIDNVVSEESKITVEKHLTECESCKKYYEMMKEAGCFTEKNYDNTEDLKMADSLKRIKIKINKKIRNIIICSVAAVLVLILAFNLLFNIPIKNIDFSDISVTVITHPMEEIATVGGADYDSVRITVDKTDKSEEYKLEIPSMPNADISVSENTIKEKGVVSIITWSSPCNIREIKLADKTDDKIIYVEAFKTTLLDNKAKGSQSITNIEFKDIEKIVFVDDGQEKVLWSK